MGELRIAHTLKRATDHPATTASDVDISAIEGISATTVQGALEYLKQNGGSGDSNNFYFSDLILNESTNKVTGTAEQISALHTMLNTTKKTPFIKCSTGNVYIICSVHYIGSAVQLSFEHMQKLYVVTISPTDSMTTSYIDCSLFKTEQAQTPITQTEYNAITNKQSILYFVKDSDGLARIYYGTTLIAKRGGQASNIGFPFVFPIIFT